MIDHILLDVISALRDALEDALLQQQAVEERFQVDVFLGDVSFETSYSLPGEGNPPRVRADVSLDWPTWSQSAYRSWSIGETPSDLPELVIEIALRIQRLTTPPDPSLIVKVLGGRAPAIGGTELDRSGPTIEQVFEADGDKLACAVEVAYQGTYRLDEAVLEAPEKINEAITPLASWIASALVHLADLDLVFLPPDEEPDPADR